MILFDGAPQERTDPRPQRDQLSYCFRSGFDLLGLQFAKEGLRLGQLLVRQGSRLELAQEQLAAGLLPPGRPHLAPELTRDQIASAGTVYGPIPCQTRQVLFGFGRKRGWRVGQAFDQDRNGLTIAGVRESQCCLKPDCGVSVGQQGSYNLPS